MTDEIIDAEYVLITPAQPDAIGSGDSASPDAIVNCDDVCQTYYCGRCNDEHDCGSGLDDPEDEPECCRGAELCRSRD